MIAMTFRLLAASVAISLLVACGGGGGVSSPQGGTENPPQTQPEVAERLPFPFAAAECDPRYAHIAGACGFDGAVDRAHFGISSVPAMRAQDSKHMPIYHDHDGSRRRMIVGVDQGTSHIGGLRSVTERGEFAVRHGTLQDGVGRGTVAAYLRDVIPSAVERYSSPPQIRIIGPSTASERQHVATAIQLVNTALPEEAKITMGTPLPTLSLRDTVNSDGINFRSGRELDNTIHIEFVPAGTFHSYPAATSWSWPSGHGGVRHSYVQFNKGANSYPRHPGQRGSSRQGTILLAHEIMHSLGIDGHASTHFDTIMEDTADIHLATQNGVQPLSLLWPVDREALRVLYGRLENGDSPADFGAWSSSALHVHGNGEHTGFGVALRNGYAEPYAYGHMQSPYSRLAEDATGGTATWNGNLVGLTPNRSAVVGDAIVRVNLTALTGTADFTALETWGPNVAPGAAGTGTMWLDGDLGYTIAVRGGTTPPGQAGHLSYVFRETGGDAGRLTGIFTGQNHEGAAGTLERTDLTAAFGATRD